MGSPLRFRDMSRRDEQPSLLSCEADGERFSSIVIRGTMPSALDQHVLGVCIAAWIAFDR